MSSVTLAGCRHRGPQFGPRAKTSGPTRITSPTPADQARILELYEAGLCLRAYRLAQRHGPLWTWQGTSAMVLAGRLALSLGGMRLGYALHFRALHNDPQSPEARLYVAGADLDREGPAAAWARMRAWGEMGENAPLEVRADWLALRASVAGRFRDFETAETLLGRAEGLTPGRPWTLLQRALLLEQQDRYEEALDAARESLRARPWYRPAVPVVAHLLLSLGRGDEARDLLFQGVALIESNRVAALLASVLFEQRRFQESLECLSLFEVLSPLLDRDGRKWLAAKRSDVLHELGDLEGARSQSALAGDPFHAALFQRLARAQGDARRVLLSVPSVRQQFKTCTPATLASLSAFWGRPLDQTAVADAICYDGTPMDRAREWAEENGWVVREFRVTWEIARALLDRGIPFALATRSGMSGHHQAVVGYDARRGTLYVRCPSQPFLGEFLAEALFEEQRESGPRGSVLLPREEAQRLAGLELPDAEAYDQLHALQVALSAHRRPEAQAIQRRMTSAAPGHLLSIWATLLLANYDCDQRQALHCIGALLRRFPGGSCLLFWKLSLLPSFASPAEYTRILEDVCARRPHDLALWSLLAHQLSLDAREHPRARRMLGELLQTGHWPTQSLNLLSLAHILDSDGRPDEALELVRFAACFEDKHESYAMTYFSAARARGRRSEALALLRRRFEALGRSSGAPVQTLFGALEDCRGTAEALEALERALSLRPSDGDLLLFAAEAHGRCGRLERADQLLSAARGRTRHATWLRSAASLASRRGDRAAALGTWHEVLVAEPFAADAHHAIASLLAATEGRAAALTHLKSACERFPQDDRLRRLRAEWEGRVHAGRPPELPSPNCSAPQDGILESPLLMVLRVLVPLAVLLMRWLLPGP